MKIALLGGGGFLGLHVARELRRREIDCVILDCFYHGEASEKAARELAACVRVDLAVPDSGAAVAAMRGCAIAINLATRNIRTCLSAPIVMAREIVAIGSVCPVLCVEAGVGYYVYVSSSEIYGEATDGALHEGSLPRPMTAYGAAKLASEHLAQGVRIAYGLPVAIVRPFNAYGPGCHLSGDAAEVIPRFIAQHVQGEPFSLHGSGTQTRDFTYVTDLARGIVDASLCNAVANTGPINLCSGVDRTIRSIATSFAPGHPIVQGPPRTGDMRHQVGCAARAQAILGWSPWIGWTEGLERTRQDVLARIT